MIDADDGRRKLAGHDVPKKKQPHRWWWSEPLAAVFWTTTAALFGRGGCWKNDELLICCICTGRQYFGNNGGATTYHYFLSLAPQSSEDDVNRQKICMYDTPNIIIVTLYILPSSPNWIVVIRIGYQCYHWCPNNTCSRGVLRARAATQWQQVGDEDIISSGLLFLFPRLHCSSLYIIFSTLICRNDEDDSSLAAAAVKNNNTLGGKKIHNHLALETSLFSHFEHQAFQEMKNFIQ